MNPIFDNGYARLYQGDARALPIADRSVHCVVTSPPYWGLRDYGLAEWEGGDPECSHVRPESVADTVYATTHNVPGGWRQNKGELPPQNVCVKCGARQQAAGIGLEPTLSEWLDNIVAVGREVWRVLRDDGVFFLNLGDAYAGSSTGAGRNDVDRKYAAGRAGFHSLLNGIAHSEHTRNDGLPAKNLMGQPWRAAFALQDDGWILRSAIVWHKPNPMPESVSDRPTNAYEMIFMFAKQPRYFYDAEAVRQPQSENVLANAKPGQQRKSAIRKEGGSTRATKDWLPERNDVILPNGANLRNVWTISTQGRPESHFATYPDELPRRCILAGTSEYGVCAECGAPWVRQVEKSGGTVGVDWAHGKTDDVRYSSGTSSYNPNADVGNGPYKVQTIGWQPTCDCNADRAPATVLDPFIGRGTTAIVAQELGRRAIGVDLNPDYLALATHNLTETNLPLF